MGEYARSLAIAHAVHARWGGAVIHFVLSRQAPYAADTPFPSTLLDSSPTFHAAAVVALITEFRPTVVIFDNAGRTAQLRAARAAGAAVIYISARRRQRRKAFRLRWMRLLDEHWIAYPQLLSGRPGWIERCKLRLLGRPLMRYLDVVLPAPDPQRRAALLARIGAAAGAYALVVPGGGTGHPRARDAVGVFYDAACTLAARGIAAVFVGPTGAAGAQQAAAAPGAAALWSYPSLPQADLAELLRGARLVIVNGGSTLLQGIASGAACIGVPIAADQTQRIRRATLAGVARAAPLNAADIADCAAQLLRDEPARAALAARAAALALADGIAVAVAALAPRIEAG